MDEGELRETMASIERMPEDEAEAVLDHLETVYQTLSHSQRCNRRVVAAAECNCVRGQLAEMLSDAGRNI